MASAIGLRELARQVGVSAAYLSRVETGKDLPSEKVLRIYSNAFCIDFDELTILAGRIPRDVTSHLVKTPGAIKRLRNQMKGKSNGKSKIRRQSDA